MIISAAPCVRARAPRRGAPRTHRRTTGRSRARRDPDSAGPPCRRVRRPSAPRSSYAGSPGRRAPGSRSGPAAARPPSPRGAAAGGASASAACRVETEAAAGHRDGRRGDRGKQQQGLHEVSSSLHVTAPRRRPAASLRPSSPAYSKLSCQARTVRWK